MANLPKIALGAWAWGNDGTFGGNFTAENLRPIFDTAMAHGLNLWDTAYAYGMGTSEKVLAGFLKGLPREAYLISDKFTPQCANGKATAMADMIEMQLQLMDLDRFDIYWIHNVWDAPHWTEELAKYYEGKDNVPLLGVSNHNLAEIRQANDILQNHGLKLSAVQNHYSLINRSSEDSGILEYCRENDIAFFAYMVLEQGALSTKQKRPVLRWALNWAASCLVPRASSQWPSSGSPYSPGPDPGSPTAAALSSQTPDTPLKSLAEQRGRQPGLGISGKRLWQDT